MSASAPSGSSAPPEPTGFTRFTRRLRARLRPFEEAIMRHIEPLEVYQVTRAVWAAFVGDGAARLAAALAFYSVFSVVPFLVLVVPIVGLVVGEDAAKLQVVGGLAKIIGDSGAAAVGAMMERATSERRDTFTTIVGVGVLLYGGLRVFRQLKDALNHVWNVRLKPGRGILGLIEDTLLPLVAMVGLAGVILATVASKAWLAELSATLEPTLPKTAWLVLALRTLFGAFVFTLLFAAMFKYLPDVRIAWRDVWVGAAVTGVLFEVSKWAIGFYLARSDLAADWGPAAFLILFLMWVYLTALLVFLGAEFTQVYANRHGSRLVPEDDAYFVGDQPGLVQDPEDPEVREGS